LKTLNTLKTQIANKNSKNNFKPSSSSSSTCKLIQNKLFLFHRLSPFPSLIPNPTDTKITPCTHSGSVTQSSQLASNFLLHPRPASIKTLSRIQFAKLSLRANLSKITHIFSKARESERDIAAANEKSEEKKKFN
jgi:hypothetical protein